MKLRLAPVQAKLRDWGLNWTKEKKSKIPCVLQFGVWDWTLLSVLPAVCVLWTCVCMCFSWAVVSFIRSSVIGIHSITLGKDANFGPYLQILYSKHMMFMSYSEKQWIMIVLTPQVSPSEQKMLLLIYILEPLW